ncbi:dihydrolipoamide acetyltransferase family protein [Flavisolibacter ginsenosidimutans]|uniref:Dihydrolipoamide acetyltransferase component of pyruvate dehydrogenase complex n=1 Tax=Flavisolibacter ginsenosidimutans TaxID=661481 RepID=A0A5B8UDR7_9BACT|nr:dihydrolipoamide acetyltransferase family protein [Flavisolibacter ginsenosidimutans]QEC54658.1 2-oxo acid dehydrogenase subunit E2 [Flavisolibacter ginsenosidimutans]
MATVDLVMPKMGESIMEATILKWLKKPGDAVKMDETVLEIATDKVDTEVPSTAEGVLDEILYNVNDVVPIGAVIARVRTGADSQQSAVNGPQTTPQTETSFQHSTESQKPVNEQRPTANDHRTAASEASNDKLQTTNKFYSPLVLNIAAQEGISMSELENIPGTGAEGRVSKKDILQYVSHKRSDKVGEPAERVEHAEHKAQHETRQEMVIPIERVEQKEGPQNNQLATYTGNVEIIEMDRMRKLIADHMVRSKHTSPHVTSFTEADVTNLVMWREKVKKDFEKREGTKITFTPLFVEAIIRCIKRFPLINSSVDGNRIIVKKDINIGMAAALPNGNLIVPVIKNADGYNLVGLAKQVNGLADNARNNKLKPEDISDGTFTLTNVGTFGSLMGTPIINQPQVAILAVGAIKKRPVVIETPQGDSIAIRHMMYLSMSYDHRIVDGSLGATFLTAVANELERFDVNRQY